MDRWSWGTIRGTVGTKRDKAAETRPATWIRWRTTASPSEPARVGFSPKGQQRDGWTDEGRVSDKTQRGQAALPGGDESADKAGTEEEEPGAARTVRFFLSKCGLNVSPSASKVGGGRGGGSLGAS